MRFWDSSAVVPLLAPEAETGVVRDAYEEDRGLVVWWATEVECVSAVAKRERVSDSGELTGPALERLDELRADWVEIEPGDALRRTARRLLRTHSLTAADAFQLAAALAASGDDPATLELVTLDDRLAGAARREGFRVLPQQG